MPAHSRGGPPLVDAAEEVGRETARGLDAIGFGASLLSQALYWIALGRRRRQPVRAAPVFAQMMDVGIRALPIVSMLSATIGVMLAIQGIYALEDFGAEQQVVFGVGLSVTREFAPLITGIVVAGRSGSALAARLGTMTISNEVDALRVMGIDPVRFLVVPSLVAMVIMLPALALWADVVALLAAGLYVSASLGITLRVFADQTLAVLDVGDLMHGLGKAAIFGVLITLVGVVNGSSADGGAEGVGRVTTRSVVQSISAIVITDMLFVFAVTH